LEINDHFKNYFHFLLLLAAAAAAFAVAAAKHIIFGEGASP
jgi:hypothetical protein